MKKFIPSSLLLRNFLFSSSGFYFFGLSGRCGGGKGEGFFPPCHVIWFILYRLNFHSDSMSLLSTLRHYWFNLRNCFNWWLKNSVENMNILYRFAFEVFYTLWFMQTRVLNTKKKLVSLKPGRNKPKPTVK